MRSSRSGWGFKIDYPAAIADDDRRIAFAESSIKSNLYRRSVGILEIQELWQLALHFPETSTALGMSDQDVADLAAYLEYDIWSSRPELTAAQAGRVGYENGKEVFAQISAIGGGQWLFKDETEARTELRRAKASRARHIRNQEKYDRDQRLRTACRPQK